MPAFEEDEQQRRPHPHQGAQQRVRVKKEAAAQRAREAEDGLVVAESIDLTGEPGLPRHMPANWEGMSAVALVMVPVVDPRLWRSLFRTTFTRCARGC